MRRTARAAILPLVALLAVLVAAPAPASAAPPAPGLIVSALKTTETTVHFVLTPRNVTTAIDPANVRVRVGTTQLATSTATAIDGVPPRAMVVILDATSAVDQAQLDAAAAAARTIAAAVPDDIWLGLVVMGPKPAVALPPTIDRNRFANTLATVARAGSMRLVDAVLETRTAFDLARVPATAERRALILLTDEPGSAASVAAAVAQLNPSGIMVDAILPTDPPGVAASLAQGTGGQRLAATSPDALSGAVQSEGSVFSAALAVTVTVPAPLAGQSAQLDISVDGTSLAVAQPVTFGGTAAAASRGQSAPVTLGWIPTWVPYVVIGIFFLAVMIAVLSVAWPRNFKHERIRQIANFGPGRAAPPPKSAVDAPVSSVIARTALAATKSVVRSGRMEERISQRLERAGMRMRAHEWVLLRTCVTITGGALLFAVISWPGGLIGAAIGWLSTVLYQAVRIDRRTNQFAEQLPDALQLVIGSLKSGFSLPQAFDSLVRESPEPVASEFGRALTEHRLGADISDALDRVAQRSQSEDLGWAVMSVRIQREVGGNLAEVLQTTVDTMRERGRLRRHVRSLSAEGRLSAYVLIGLPVGLGAFMFAYRGSYMKPLVTDPLGITMLSLGGLLFILGIFWMTRVIKVEA